MTIDAYKNGKGIARALMDFSTAPDERMGTEEDVEDSRLGVGYGFIGHENGKFISRRND